MPERSRTAPANSPTSTYRLQLHAGFGFGEVTRVVVPYLSRLGISHLYLSPILQAVPGSLHGYDVVDHSRVSADLGGEDRLVELADLAHAHGLGIVVDVVPNHMAVPTPEYLNAQLWETLRDGPEASTAHWFDVEWSSCGGKLGLPVLRSSLEDTLAAGELILGSVGKEQVLCYGDHRFPLARGTQASDLGTLLSEQHYLLAHWRERPDVLNYRRFFDVDALIAVRVELDDVFDATHALLVDLYRLGVVDGFRIDHPDGLADPQRYLERLCDATDGAWVVVEKILAPDEHLPLSWACAGTTGYDAIRVVEGALVPAVGPQLDEIWRDAGGEPSLSDVEVDAKRLVLANLLQPEIRRLVRGALAAAGGAAEFLAADAAESALTEVLAHVEVYRAYLRRGSPAGAEALDRLGHAFRLARLSRPDLEGPLGIVHQLVTDTAATSVAGADFVVQFQQVCGPVMAKGVEDTAFYRWHRMIALNEVGGDPLTLDSPGTEPIHEWAQRQASHHPQGMTALSTHDTKRNEDIRARLLGAAEDLDGWRVVWAAVRREAAGCGVDGPTAYFVMQTLLGAAPLEVDRLLDYLRKAVRETKRHTSWTEPDEAYERRVFDLAQLCRCGAVAETIADAVNASAHAARATTLASKLLQLTLPGVPDVYQGEELAAPALVDPDNRRRVDFAVRDALLQRLDSAHSLPGAGADLSAEKLWVTSRALRLRRDHPELFGVGASYQPLDSDSPLHLLGFVRAGRVATAVTRWPGRLARLGWSESRVRLPPGRWIDVLTGTAHDVGAAGARCDVVLAKLPVALLLRDWA